MKKPSEAMWDSFKGVFILSLTSSILIWASKLATMRRKQLLQIAISKSKGTRFVSQQMTHACQQSWVSNCRCMASTTGNSRSRRIPRSTKCRKFHRSSSSMRRICSIRAISQNQMRTAENLIIQEVNLPRITTLIILQAQTWMVLPPTEAGCLLASNKPQSQALDSWTSETAAKGSLASPPTKQD